MPLYQYGCGKCSHEFEVFHKIDETIAIECPECGGKKVKKLVTPFRTNLWSQFLDDMERKVSPHKFK
jgi:putative FmdB family regulatory protein